MVCKLNKSLYGIKQAPRSWNHKLDESLTQMGVRGGDANHILYTFMENGIKLFVTVYVDDLLIASNSASKID